jgi:toxin ParE1/3/4
MPTIKRTAQAEEDRIGIRLYIAQDSAPAAHRVLDEIEEKFILLADQSFLGPAHPAN